MAPSLRGKNFFPGTPVVCKVFPVLGLDIRVPS